MNKDYTNNSPFSQDPFDPPPFLTGSMKLRKLPTGKTLLIPARKHTYLTLGLDVPPIGDPSLYASIRHYRS